ncbi:hypothetical protein V6N13_139931 [Hibiscus sabdariffa]
MALLFLFLPMSQHPLEGLTAGSTQGDGTSPGKPPERMLAPSGVQGGVTDARGLDLTTGENTHVVGNCCVMTDMDARVTHVVDLEKDRPSESAIAVTHDTIGMSSGTCLMTVDQVNVFFRDKVVGMNHIGVVIPSNGPSRISNYDQ